MGNYPEEIVKLLKWLDEQLAPLEEAEKKYKEVSRHTDIIDEYEYLTKEQIGAMVALYRTKKKIYELYP